MLLAIYVAPAAGAPMMARERADVIEGRGLAGDRYAQGEGYYRLTDACQVTVIDGEALARIERRTRIALGRGEHRRNLVVRGVDLARLASGRLRIGDVTFAYQRPRPPCGYLERLTQPGIVRALRRDGGLCLRAIQGGVVRVGDPVVVL